jgi:hypothetical protein
MTFVERPISTPLTEGIDGSRSFGHGLPEPSMVAAACPRTRCKGGVVLYVTAHTAGVFTTRSPAFYSRNRGRTWHTMPGIAPTGSTRPAGGVQGTEADFAADRSGRAWLFDAGTAVAGLYGFCGHGAEQCEFVPTMNDDPQCGPNVVTDRPWLGYGDGKLLLAANGAHRGTGTMQLAVYDPDGVQAGANPDWNACHLAPGGAYGHPAVSPSGDFVVPRTPFAPGPRLFLIEGNLNRGVATDQVRTREIDEMAFPAWQSTMCEGRSQNWGFSGFDATGTGYVVTWASETEFAIAAGPAGGQLRVGRFDAHGKLSFVWLSGSQRGDGALVTWAVERGCNPDPTDAENNVDRSDLYAGHVRLVDGVPTLANEAKVAENVVGLKGDYLGSSLGPDGKAYLVAYSSQTDVTVPGHEPLSVFIQKGGPKL